MIAYRTIDLFNFHFLILQILFAVSDRENSYVRMAQTESNRISRTSLFISHYISAMLNFSRFNSTWRNTHLLLCHCPFSVCKDCTVNAFLENSPTLILSRSYTPKRYQTARIYPHRAAVPSYCFVLAFLSDKFFLTPLR